MELTMPPIDGEVSPLYSILHSLKAVSSSWCLTIVNALLLIKFMFCPQFAMKPNYLHIWPRNTFMMIALPNLVSVNFIVLQLRV